jgi:hypothetical protein
VAGSNDGRDRHCRLGVRYETYQEADEQAWYAMARRSAAEASPIVVTLRCNGCGGYHVVQSETPAQSSAGSESTERRKHHV